MAESYCVCLILQEVARVFPKMVVPLCIPPAKYECSTCAISLPELDTVLALFFFFFYFSPSNRNVIVSHCDVNFYFLHNSFCSTSFHELICHLHIIFDETYMKSFVHIFTLDYLKLECVLLLLRTWQFLFEPWEFFMNSRHKSFIRLMFCKYFLPVYGLCFYSLSVSWGKVLNYVW